MKTPEEIKDTLELCYTGTCDTLKHRCPYSYEGNCTDIVMSDALDYIEQLEERINLMLIQMRGYCGCCAYKGRPSYKSPCTECLCGENRPMWEYEGLPELTKEESNA